MAQVGTTGTASGSSIQSEGDRYRCAPYQIKHQREAVAAVMLTYPIREHPDLELRVFASKSHQ